MDYIASQYLCVYVCLCMCVCARACSVTSVLAGSLWPHELRSLLGFTVHWIIQARILEWVAMPSSTGSSLPRHRTCISCTISDSLPTELLGKPLSVKGAPNSWQAFYISFFTHLMCLVWEKSRKVIFGCHVHFYNILWSIRVLLLLFKINIGILPIYQFQLGF